MGFYLPDTTGSWLTWIAASLYCLVGILYLLFPKGMANFLNHNYPEGTDFGFIRANLGGLRLGLGLSYLVFDQLFLAVALGVAAFFAAFGWLIGFILDHSFSRLNVLLFVLELLISLVTLGYGLSFIS